MSDDDLIRRLREACPGCRCSYCVDDKRDARREIERLRAALKNLYGLMCDMENDGHVTESLYNGVMQHTKEVLGDNE